MLTKLTKSYCFVFAIISLLALMILLFYISESARAQSQNSNSGYVLIRVKCLEIRALPPDLADGDVAELQLMVIISDGEQVNGAFTFFQDSPSTEVRPVRSGERFCETDANGPWFAVDEARDQVVVWFVALDSDDLNLIESSTMDAASVTSAELLAKGFKELIGDTGVLSILSRSNLVSAVLDFAFNRALEVWELPDTIGEHQTVLRRQQRWNLNSYTEISADGNIVIDYDVLLMYEEPQNEPGSFVISTTIPEINRVATDLDSLFGVDNWFCFPDKQNAVGVRYLPPGLTVQSPIDHVDTYVGSFYQGETVTIRTGATVWLQGFVPLNSCPDSQIQALRNWMPDDRGVTREYLDNVFGSQNWRCSDRFSFLVLVGELPQNFYVEYPFTSVDTTTNLKYGVGDTVPGGSGASVWTLEISRNQCR